MRYLATKRFATATIIAFLAVLAVQYGSHCSVSPCHGSVAGVGVCCEDSLFKTSWDSPDCDCTTDAGCDSNDYSLGEAVTKRFRSVDMLDGASASSISVQIKFPPEMVPATSWHGPLFSFDTTPTFLIISSFLC